jgi:hypothetical protein
MKEMDVRDKEIPKRSQEEKKVEKKTPRITIREKSAIKRTKVHKALRISTPDDSEGDSGPKENPAPEKEIVVEKDQVTSAEGKDGEVSKDNITPAEGNAPSLEKKDDPQTNPDNQDDKVISTPFFFSFIIFFKFLWLLK